MQSAESATMEIGETLDVTSPAAFRRWLRDNHDEEAEIWLVQYKARTGKASIDYLEAVEEAICYGWIDGFVKSMDADRYATRFTPRRPKSHWSDSNIQRARRMIARGKMTEAGRAKLPVELLTRAPAGQRA
ncbi:MAG: YdeI/OmpD-associated family protein [Anaerolineales bacterium]